MEEQKNCWENTDMFYSLRQYSSLPSFQDFDLIYDNFTPLTLDSNLWFIYLQFCSWFSLALILQHGRSHFLKKNSELSTLLD